MRTLSVIALSVALPLMGCSAVASKKAEPAAPVAQAAKAEKLPEVELSADLLYRVLLGEIAGQRGSLDIAAESYSRAAGDTRDPRLARRATQIALYSRNFEAAKRAARLWVEVAPEDADARQSMAALLIRDGNTEQALIHLREVVKLVSGDDADHGYLVVARLLAAEQDKARALEAMQRLVEEAGDNPRALYAHAYLAAQLGASDRALATLERVLARDGEAGQALVLKAAVLTQLGRKEEALADYALALKRTPEDSNLRLAYARELIAASRLAEAREQFRILAERLPTSPDVLYAQGLLAAEAKEYQEATTSFEQLIKLGQRANEARYNLGQMAEQQGDEARAMQWYAEVAPGGANYLEAQFRYAMLLSKKEGLDKALAHLSALEAPADQRYRVVGTQGELLREAGRLGEAMALFDAALAGEHARNHDLLYSRAMLGEQMGRLDILERDLRLVIFEDPENAHALNALGYTLAERTDRLEEAYGYIKRALAKDPEEPAILDSMGWVLYRLGRLDEALPYLQRAYARNQDGEIAGHLGAVLWAMGDRDEARRIWNQALKLDPDHKALQAIIDKTTQ